MFKIVLESAKMFSAQNKIHKDKGVAPTEFEERVAQVLASCLFSLHSCKCFRFLLNLKMLFLYS